jgi:transcriptional regulator with XRE-family HTH domain
MRGRGQQHGRLTKMIFGKPTAEAKGTGKPRWEIQHIAKIERNRSKLPIGTLRKICDVLGVHMSWFFPSTPAGPPGERALIVRARCPPESSG